MNMILKLLLSTAAAVYVFSSPVMAMEPDDKDASTSMRRPSYTDLKAQLVALYPYDFDSLSPAYMQAIYGFQRALSSVKRTAEDAFSELPNGAFEPLAREMEAFLTSYQKTHPHHEFTRKLLRELAVHKEEGELTPSLLWGIPLRHAASRSNPSEAERDLFRNFPHPEVFSDPLEKEAWKYKSAFRSSIDDEEDLNTFTTLPGSLQDKIRDQMKPFFPHGVSAPLMGKGKLPLSMLVENLLDHVFLAGVPLEELTVHGIQKVSAYGFGIHDLLHRRVDHRYSHLLQHILNRANEHVAKGGDVHKFVETYPEMACRRYNTLMNSLRKVYERLLGDLVQDKGLLNLLKFRKAMVGFFWVMHEATFSPNFGSELYETDNLEEIFKIITGPTVFNEYELEDPLKTNPLTGESSLSNEEIIAYVIEDEKLLSGSLEDLLRTSPPTVDRTPQFIRVTLKFPNGEEKVVSYQTLYYKWNQMDDNLGLLQGAGVEIEKPDLRGVEDPQIQRERALETLAHVQEALVAQVALFQQKALATIASDSNGSGNTLAAHYAEQYHAQEERLMKECPQGILRDSQGRLPGADNYGNPSPDDFITDKHGRNKTHRNYGNELPDDQLPDEHGREPRHRHYMHPLPSSQLDDDHGRWPGALNYGNELPDDQLPDQYGRRPGEFNYGDLLSNDQLPDKHGRWPSDPNHGKEAPEADLSSGKKEATD